MTKPDDMPQDIWDTAAKLEVIIDQPDYVPRHVLLIAQTIRAERISCVERTAKLPFPRAIAEAILSPEHASDCAVHNEPAYPNGPCDCGAVQTVTYPPEMLPSAEEGDEVQIVVVNGPEHDRIRHYAKSAINGFETLDTETAIENAKFDLLAILRLVG